MPVASFADYLEDDSSVESNCEALLHELDSSLWDEDISNWLLVDADDQGYQLLSDIELIQQVTSQLCEDTPEDMRLNMFQVAEVSQKCLTSAYSGMSDNQNAQQLLQCFLLIVRDLAATERFTSLKQTTLDAYFN